MTAAARGRGLGDAMMRLAIARVAADNRGILSLAVDAANTPALRLYYRHGLSRVGHRVALVRDLRTLRDAASPVPDPLPHAG